MVGEVILIVWLIISIFTLGYQIGRNVTITKINNKLKK
jgi:hypothetical protein